MIIAGIDYSMTSPALCIFDTSKKLAFENTNIFVYSNKNKLEGKTDNIIIMKHMLYDSPEQRFDNISEWVLSILTKFKVKKISMEGYSMGSKGVVFNIGENTGVLKHKLFKNNIEITSLPTPTQVKQSFSGKGNAKKKQMYEAFLLNEKYDIISKLNITSKDPYESPVSDIVDSYAVLNYMIKNLEY